LHIGLANEGRQQLIDEQTGIIYAVLESPRYNDHRNTQINFYTRRLRDMCEGLINESCDRNQAGLDLGAIIIFAYDLTVDMFTSGFSFQIFFPNTSEKFTASTMIARDQPRLTPLEIQLKQMRLKLVITPVVTMRDDHGTTIKAKNLFLATTLTMV
jgi:cell division protein FtsI/penicillin-binding protein 2